MPPRRNEILPGRTQKERKQARRTIGKLTDQVIQVATKNRYEESFKRFLRFHNLSPNFCMPPPDVFDDMVGSYVEYLWEAGAPKSDASYVMAGIQHKRPQAKHKLPWAWRLVKAWHQIELPCRATPLTPELLLALAGQAFTFRQTRMGWLLVLAFSLFLRTGELIQLLRKDCIIPIDEGQPPVVILIGTKTTKKNLLPLEKLVVEEALARKALRFLTKGLKPGDTLSQMSNHTFRSLWQSLLVALDLSGLGFAPYSLRRGGATSAYRNGATLDVLMTRGRWSHQKTARLYLDQGAQAVALLKLPASASQKCRKARAKFLAMSQEGTRGKSH